MQKYMQIYKATILENLQYISNILIRLISFIIMIFVLFNLWQYLYKDSSDTINGYTLNQMLWYVLITEGIWFGVRNKAFSYEISDNIKSGNIAYNVNKPYNYVVYVIFKNLGDITIKGIIFGLVVIIFGNVFIGSLNIPLISIPIIILTLIICVFIHSMITISISLISFWIEDSTPFHWVYDKMILIFGTLLPIEMFPMFLRPIISCLPTYVIMYGPAKLIIDFSFGNFIKIFLVQVIYLLISGIVMSVMFSRGVKKLNVNGG